MDVCVKSVPNKVTLSVTQETLHCGWEFGMKYKKKKFSLRYSFRFSDI